jgi:hypothetical protein
MRLCMGGLVLVDVARHRLHRLIRQLGAIGGGICVRSILPACISVNHCSATTFMPSCVGTPAGADGSATAAAAQTVNGANASAPLGTCSLTALD